MALSRRSSEEELLEGMRLLDRYTILDRVGAGGMATIYRATDDRLDRVVCIKLLRRTLVQGSSGASATGRAMFQATYSHFLQEALALSKLQHPNTLRIYDFGYLDSASPEPSAPFHVSEYLDGGNIETHVRLRGAFPAGEVLGILEGISGALAEAHEHGIIHRDIKPSNILFARVRSELVPKLADFGIAHSDLVKKSSSKRPSARAPAEPVSAVALFSPRWAAPEQLCGSSEGARTDVYALGLLACFMFTGRVLFGDEDVRLTFNDRVRGDELVNARLAEVGVTGDVGRVLLQSLRAQADLRMESAPKLFELLREALNITAPKSVVPFPFDRKESGDVRRENLDCDRESALQEEQTRVYQRAQDHTLAMAPKSGVVPVALDADTRNESLGPSRAPQPTQGHVAPDGGRRVRVVYVHEKLDLSSIDTHGASVRVRVTILPAEAGSTQRLNVKGLSCFVGRRGQKPSPALTVAADGGADLVSATRQILGEIAWSFGEARAEGRVFVVDGKQVLVPYAEAQLSVCLLISPGDELVVMCRR